MKTGLIICSPDVTHEALALLSGTFGEKVAKAAEMGTAAQKTIEFLRRYI